MTRSKWTATISLVGLLLLCTRTVSAQAIAGVVTDSSGGVLPGVTVEASSPALIEGTRTAVTDSAGRYSIVNLRPGVYAVKFALSGFSAVERQGITITSDFTAPVNVELRVGSISEVVTVTGETPQVDVTSVSKPQTISSEMLDVLPLGNRTIQSVLGTVSGTSFTVFGQLQYRGSGDTLLTVDGNRTTWVGGPGPGASTQTLSAAAYQEYTVTQGLDNLDSATGGVRVNVVPKDGGNEFRGSMFLLYSGEGWNADNIPDRYKVPPYNFVLPADETLTLDVNPTFGGPVKRNRLWFQNTFHFKRNDAHVLGLYADGNPDPFVYQANFTDSPVAEQVSIGGGTRLTWQLTSQDKVSGFYDDEYAHWPTFFATAGASPESATNYYNPRSRNTGVKWTRTHTARLLLEAGMSAYRLDLFNDLREPMLDWSARRGAADLDAQRLPAPVTENMEVISGIGFGTQFGIGRQPAGGFTGSGSSMSVSKTVTANASATYITGSHSFRSGVTFLHGTDVNKNRDIGDVVLIVNNGVPAQITATLPSNRSNTIDADWGLYAQDTWTIRRLTLKGGLRFDWLTTSYPDQVLPGSIWQPSSQTCAINRQFCGADVLNWKDLSPRAGAVYDLFGNGRTALKVGFARYVAGETIGVTNGVNPVTGLSRTTTGNWTDLDNNRNIYASNGTIQRNEINVGLPYAGGFQNPSFGTTVISTRYDPDVLRGFGKRGYTWEYDAGIDHQLIRGLSASLTYYHRSDGNQRATDNLNLTAADYSGPFCLVVPRDSRLGDVSGSTVCDLFDLTPAGTAKQFLPASNFVTFAKNLGTGDGYEEINQGFDIVLTSRLGARAFVSAGIDIRSSLTDRCSFPVVAGFFGGLTETAETRFCRNETAYNALPRVNGAYVLPLGIQLAASYRATRGPQFQALWTATNADVAAAAAAGVPQQLGRPFSAFNGQRSVTLIEPNTEYLEYLHAIDVRLSKIIDVSASRVTVGLDLYNAFNRAGVTGIRTGFGTTAAPAADWLNPTGIVSPLRFRLSGTIDF